MHPPLSTDRRPSADRFPPDPQGKAKKNAWQKEVDEGTTAEQAQTKYVNLVNKLKESYGFDADKVPEAVGA